MDETRLGRRRLLVAAGSGLFGAVAGCLEPGSGNPSNTADTTSTDSIDEHQSDTEIDRDNRAEGSTYTDVYEHTIDSVALVRVFGIENPFTGDEGRGQGSAFFYDDSHLITNEHVVYGGEEIDVRYTNGDWSETTLVGTDFYSDLAVLEVDHVPAEATPLPLSEQFPVVGQEVLAIGNPFGLEGSMTQGIVSGVNRSLDMPGRSFTFPNVVQTDAAINPGNSGGPLVNLDGAVVGVINAGGGDNIGFAISAALTRRIVPELVETGSYRHSYMGIGLQTVDPLIAEENDLSTATGVIVTDVQSDGPAADVLEPMEHSVTRHGASIPVGGDVIFEMDGEPIPDRHALSTFLALETTPGDEISIDVWRDGSPVTVEMTLGTRPPPERFR